MGVGQASAKQCNQAPPASGGSSSRGYPIRDVLNAPKWYERLRAGTIKEGTLAASAGTLAADYQALAEEVLSRLVAAEATGQGTSRVTA